jgi:hypothetical protein
MGEILTPGASLGWLPVLAWSHAVLALAYLLVLIAGLHGMRRLLMRRRVPSCSRLCDCVLGSTALVCGGAG